MQIGKYTFTEDMYEISGFGGPYEECCRKMLVAGLEWLEQNPEANPVFSSFKNVFGVVFDENEDAKNLTAAIVKGAGEYGPTGAMVHAVVAQVLWIKDHGWEEYVRLKTHPEGQVGILKERVRGLEVDKKELSGTIDRLRGMVRKRNAVIARNVLQWEKHPISHSDQRAFGPSKEAVSQLIRPGEDLDVLVDMEINSMDDVA